MESLVFVSSDSRLFTDSRRLAENFGMKHCNVLQKIERILADTPRDFQELNFQLLMYSVEVGKGATKSLPMYNMTRDGFMHIALTFNKKKGCEFRVKVINAFNEMETRLLKPADTHLQALCDMQAKQLELYDKYTKSLEELNKLQAKLLATPAPAAPTPPKPVSKPTWSVKIEPNKTAKISSYHVEQIEAVIRERLQELGLKASARKDFFRGLKTHLRLPYTCTFKDMSVAQFPHAIEFIKSFSA